ncbi:ATP-binding protein [Dactylosporangium sp. CA-139066]|uniref:ATP-binding protein n=1 Tax=Dactylosporangium sp. CA-139066 TaxID=3239930 RepID=UPI003D94A154
MMGVMSTGRVEVSRREAEVLAALGERLSNAEIAAKLYISVRTVETHVSSLLRKFGVTDRWALADQAAAVDGFESVGAVGLPAVWTSFVGRTCERRDVATALSGSRLVTLLGPGGVGKTRLAGVAAEETAGAYPGGVTFVDLVPVRDGFVAQAVAAVLGVVEGPQQPLESAIAERLGQRRSLLVLDNCEHMIGSVALFVDSLLAGQPRVRVLTTSRERLGLGGERVVRIAPLPTDDAVTLFMDRANDGDAGFSGDPAALAALCAQLDGLPLAVELAAARGAALGLDGLLAGAQDQLRLLSGGRGRNERHRSLRSMLAWSYDLLDEPAQTLFRRLAVFVGGFGLAAAAAVSGRGLPETADVLGRLVDQSLLVHDQSRWRMLATVRAYAMRLAADAPAEAATARERHLVWATEAAQRLEDEPDADFDAAAADLRAAAGYRPTSYLLVRSLGRLTFRRRFLQEAAEHFRTAATLAPSPALAVADLISAADCVFVSTASGPEAYRLLLAAADRAVGTPARVSALCRVIQSAGRHQVVRNSDTVGDDVLRMYEEAKAGADHDDPVEAATVAVAGGWFSAGDPIEHAERSLELARISGDPVLISSAVDAVGYQLHRAGRIAEAIRVNRERATLLDRLDATQPRDAAEIGDIYLSACVDAMFTGDLRAALAAARRLPPGGLYGTDSYVATGMEIAPLVLTGDLDGALSRATRLIETWERAGRTPSGLLPAVFSMASLASRLRGDRPGAAR